MQDKSNRFWLLLLCKCSPRQESNLYQKFRKLLFLFGVPFKINQLVSNILQLQ